MKNNILILFITLHFVQNFVNICKNNCFAKQERKMCAEHIMAFYRLHYPG